MSEVPGSSNVHSPAGYRGRIAPSPTGLLHLGHARTFWIAFERAQAANGVLVYRNEDLDPQRSKPEFVTAAMEDLRWLGLDWREGPDVGGRFAPYDQGARRELHRAVLLDLIVRERVFACTCSRRDISSASQAPHGADDEPVYPGTCRHRIAVGAPRAAARLEPAAWGLAPGTRFSLRLRTPDGGAVRFVDHACGPQSFEPGRDFGDFILWRHDDVPSYQLAVVADDLAMRITEVVRGEDLLVSAARQLLLYEILQASAPAFLHCALVRDERGERLAKRSESSSLRALRAQGRTPAEVRALWNPGVAERF